MEPDRRSRGLLGRSQLGEFTSLFLFLLLLLLVPPMLPSGPLLRWVPTMAFTAVLLSAVAVVADRRRALWAALLLVLPALVLQWWAAVGARSETVAVLGNAAVIFFLLFVTVLILRHVLRAPAVDREIVLAALCAYLLFGLMWGVAYDLLAGLDPSAFSLPAVSAAAARESAAEAGRTYMYFSYVTLTTLGYGDVIPLSAPARALAISEAILGQLYLVTAIASLVSTSVKSEAPAGD
jgi:hypothetical protein